jgi:hypothetical protein
VLVVVLVLVVVAVMAVMAVAAVVPSVFHAILTFSPIWCQFINLFYVTYWAFGPNVKKPYYLCNLQMLTIS